MPEQIFNGIFATTAATIPVGKFILCVAISLLCGSFLAFCYTYRTRYTGSFLATLFMLPAVVCVVIMMVNGNVGAGVAVAGAFSLVRFRSVPGTAKEITMLFLAMGAGLICGMGYLAYGVLFTMLLGLVTLLWSRLEPFVSKSNTRYRTLSITIPEDLNYGDVFHSILSQYTISHELTRVKTTNMGAMFRLTYNLNMKTDADEKEMLDALRCRNGNLEISLSRQDTTTTEL